MVDQGTGLSPHFAAGLSLLIGRLEAHEELQAVIPCVSLYLVRLVV